MTFMPVKHLPVFWNLFMIYTRQSFYHRKAALTTVLTWSLRCGITILLYAAIYRMLGQSHIRGVDYDVAISGILLSAVFYGFATREVSFQINAENKSGMLEVWVNKPLSYVGLKMVEALGRSLPAVCGLIMAIVVFWCAHGRVPAVDHLAWRIVMGFFLLLLGVAIALCLFAMSGLTAVFIQDAMPANQLMDRLVSLFSGAFIPIGFYPHWFRLVGESLPMGATTYVAQIFYPQFFDTLPRFLLMQVFWLVVCAFALNRFAARVQRRLTVNGG